ncbi:IS66 family insertion sequence element accessory protein TnpB [Shewanella sp. S1-49-MNA-CIBAN-0167]|uniref:IS66 family insertion sequence element accessory protein TnpA n=1 Tax=Shewanella sp. S1-49-MNA-CIBAN-0167 TaxID=3140468 RepID=UPI0033247DE5
MATRSHEDWAALIQQHPASGLTISAFCRQHKLSVSGFYARKADMAKTNSQPIAPFVMATLTSLTAMTTQAQPSASAQAIHFQHHTGLWTFPSSLPPSYLLEIIKGLQAC